MLIIREKAGMKEWSEVMASKEKNIGFVPTMGALHKGHLSLAQKAMDENDLTVLSLFVNKRQFNNAVDYQKYPRTEAADLNLAAGAGIDVIFMPDAADLFRPPVLPDFDLKGLDDIWEGKLRPGHFKGVTEVVWQLFKAVQPSQAYFGEKDFQQVLVIRRLMDAHFPHIKLSVEPTIRESDGLAMSSRNVRLSPNGRKRAASIFKVLNYCAKEIQRYEHWDHIQVKALKDLKGSDIETEYLEWVYADNLQPVQNAEIENTRLIFAGSMDGVRLIDNIKVA